MTRRAELRVDLNADLGEEVTDDAALLRLVTSANLACGYHAGTPQIMRAVCEQAAGSGVVIGAQVSYADRDNFGRRPLDVAADVLRDQIADQCETLAAIATSCGTHVEYLKPHGALYHRVLVDPEQAAAVLAGSGSLPVLTMAGVLADQASAAGRRVWLEGFPDRGYDGGRLIPRGAPGALIHDDAAVVAQALALAPLVDSLCLHGDSPGAVARAQAVRTGLEAAGWQLRAVEPPRLE